MPMPHPHGILFLRGIKNKGPRTLAVRDLVMREGPNPRTAPLSSSVFLWPSDSSSVKVCALQVSGQEIHMQSQELLGPASLNFRPSAGTVGNVGQD